MTLVNLNLKLKKLDSKTVPASYKGKTTIKKVRLLLAVLIILVIAVAVPAYSIYQSSRHLLAISKQLSLAVKQENFDQIKSGLSDIRAPIQSVKTSLLFLSWMRVLPFIGGYVSDMNHLVKAVDYELTAGEKSLLLIEPYKVELGLVGQPIDGQDRIAQGLKILNKILPSIDQIEPSLKLARQEIEQINTGKYPEKIKSRDVRTMLEQVKNGIIGADILVAENKDLLLALPSVLGDTSTKTYLLLFQNDKELRPTGGFMTAYAFLKMDQGRVSATASDDIYRLDEQLLKVCLNKICPLTPPAPIVKYLPEMDGKPRKAWSMRDSNLSPDLPTSAKEFEKMYQMLGNGDTFDGIIMIDTKVVEDLIAITGPIDIFGTQYSAEIDKRCNCPDVIYELEHYAEVAAKGEADRKAVLGTLMQQIMAKSLGSGVDKLPKFIFAGINLANNKDIMYYMHDPALQSSLSKLNWTGEVAKTSGDYVYLNEANFAGGKSNLYVDEKVTIEIDTGNSAVAKHKITIEYKNPEPFSTWLNGILRSYVRLYVPTGSKLITSKGSDDPVQTQDDVALAKTYYEAFVTVRPQNSRVLSFEYEVPFKPKDGKYSLLTQKQPGAKNHHYLVKLNGKTKAEFNLTTDQKLELPI